MILNVTKTENRAQKEEHACRQRESQQRAKIKQRAFADRIASRLNTADKSDQEKGDKKQRDPGQSLKVERRQAHYEVFFHDRISYAHYSGFREDFTTVSKFHGNKFDLYKKTLTHKTCQR